HRGIGYQATDIMYRVVTFNRIPRHVIDLLSHERLGKFLGKFTEDPKIMIKKGFIRGAVCEPPVNAAAFCACLAKYSGRRFESGLVCLARAVRKDIDIWPRLLKPTMNNQLMAGVRNHQSCVSLAGRTVSGQVDVSWFHSPIDHYLTFLVLRHCVKPFCWSQKNGLTQ